MRIGANRTSTLWPLCKKVSELIIPVTEMIGNKIESREINEARATTKTNYL